MNESSHGSNRQFLNSEGSSFLQKPPLIKQFTDEKKVHFITTSSLNNPLSEVQKLQYQYKQLKTNDHNYPFNFTRERNNSFQIKRNNSVPLKKIQKDQQNAEELVLQRQDCSIIYPESYKSKLGSSSSLEKNVYNSDLESQFYYNSSSINNQFMQLPHDQQIHYQNQSFKRLTKNREQSASIQSIRQLNHWPKPFILVIIVISRMLKKTRMIKQIQNVNRMTCEQFIVINDLASSFDVIKRIKKKKLIYLLYFDACFIIQASFKFMLIWNIIMLFLYLSSMFLIPTYQIFDKHRLKDQHFQDNMININSICQTELNFENIFIQQKQIKQLKNNIKYDLIIFTTLLAYYVSGNIYLVFTIMLLIFSLNNIFKQIYEKFNLYKARRFAYCIFVYTTMNHYSALIWIYFIILPSQNSLYEIYIQSIHYIMIGNQTQTNEQMSTNYYLGDCLLNIKTLIIISFFVIQIYYYLSNNNSNGFEASFQSYKRLGLPYKTLRNLIIILRYRYENRGIQDNHELNVINDNEREQKKEILMISNSIFRQQVGDQIMDQIQIDLFLNIIQNSQVIKNLCSNQCVKTLCNKIEICQFNENDKNDLYFLISGIAQKVLTGPNVKLETIKAKAILNEISFLNQQKCDYRYDFSSNCKFGRLSFIDFIETLRQYPQGFQIYYMFRENYLFNQSNLRCIFNCPICKSHLHSLKSCQATTLLFDRPELIKENQRLIQNKRQNYARNNTIRFNTLNNKSYIQISVIGFGLEQNIFREKEITNEVLNILKGNSSSNHSGFTVLNTQTIDFNSSLGKTSSLEPTVSIRKQSNNSNSASIPRSFMTKNSEKSQSPIQNLSSPKKSSIQELELNKNEEIFHNEKREFDMSDLAHSYHYYFPAKNLNCILRQLQRNRLIRKKRNQGQKLHNYSNQQLKYQTSIKLILQ